MKDLEQIKARLIKIPKDTKGILLFEIRNVKKEALIYRTIEEFIIENKLDVIVMMCRNVEGVKFLPIK